MLALHQSQVLGLELCRGFFLGPLLNIHLLQIYIIGSLRREVQSHVLALLRLRVDREDVAQRDDLAGKLKVQFFSGFRHRWLGDFHMLVTVAASAAAEQVSTVALVRLRLCINLLLQTLT